MSNIVVPQLGESVVEARVARWLKKEGDAGRAGEPLVELETDKIDLEVGADQAGVLARIDRQEGEDVKVGEVLGRGRATRLRRRRGAAGSGGRSQAPAASRRAAQPPASSRQPPAASLPRRSRRRRQGHRHRATHRRRPRASTSRRCPAPARAGA